MSALRLRYLVEDARSYASHNEHHPALAGALAGSVWRLAHSLVDDGCAPGDIKTLIALGLQAGRSSMAATVAA